MGLEAGGIDHQEVGLAGLAREPGEDAVEHAEAAPAHEAIVERLVGTVARGSIAPSHARADYMDDAAEDPPVVDTCDPVRERKERFDPRHLRVREPERISHATHLPAEWNQLTDPSGSALPLMGPEPSITVAILC